jgi:hypothetical protein
LDNPAQSMCVHLEIFWPCSEVVRWSPMASSGADEAAARAGQRRRPMRRQHPKRQAGRRSPANRQLTSPVFDPGIGVLLPARHRNQRRPLNADRDCLTHADQRCGANRGGGLCPRGNCLALPKPSPPLQRPCADRSPIIRLKEGLRKSRPG